MIYIELSVLHDICVRLPGFQLHPTFSEQPPTNGVKTWLVKMCRGQHTAAYLLLCVKITFTRTGISTFLHFWRAIPQTVFTQSKRYIHVVRADGFCLSVCILGKELDGCLCHSVKENFKQTHVQSKNTFYRRNTQLVRNV